MAAQRDEKEVEFLGALSVASHLTDEATRLRTFTAAAASPPLQQDVGASAGEGDCAVVDDSSDDEDGAEPQPEDCDPDGSGLVDGDSDDDNDDTGAAGDDGNDGHTDEGGDLDEGDY